ncbi:MAG: hypothetical protein ACMXYC_01890 [Candidatus Woesearchaeota archaeon]
MQSICRDVAKAISLGGVAALVMAATQCSKQELYTSYHQALRQECVWYPFFDCACTLRGELHLVEHCGEYVWGNDVYRY